MTIARETDLGKISISNAIFAQIIMDAMEQESCRGKVWPSTKRGRQLGGEQMPDAADYGSHIEAERSLDGESIDLEFSIIIRFGTSIRRVTDALGGFIAQAIYEKQGRYPHQVKIRIAGVRSRQIARRNLEVIKNYAAK